MRSNIDEIKGELISYKTKDNLTMNGFLCRSRKGNKTVIIEIFGMISDFFSSPRNYAMSKVAKGKHVDFLFAGNRGMGSVFPFDKDGKDVFIGTAREKFTDCIFDIKAAVDTAYKMGYKRIILQGHSTGCQKSTYYLYKTGDKRIKGLILMGATGDYDILKKELGRKLPRAVRIARNMIKAGKTDQITPNWISYYTPQRFLSYAIPTNPEARMFNYDSNLKEFSKIKCPILVIFGSKEQHATKPIKEHINILKKATTSSRFDSAIINGSNHSFKGKEREFTRVIVNWPELT